MHRGRPRLLGKQGQLPDDGAPAQVVHHALATVGFDHDAQPPAGHQVQAIGGVALVEKHLTGGQVHRFKLPGDLEPGGFVERCEERDAGQELAQFGQVSMSSHH